MTISSRYWLVTMFIFLISSIANAEVFSWKATLQNVGVGYGGTATQACVNIMDVAISQGYKYKFVGYRAVNESNGSCLYVCTHAHCAGQAPYPYTANRSGTTCPAGTTYNLTKGECGNDREKGAPSAIGCVGNPISLAVGNKFQAVNDGLPGLSFIRFYNSLDGFWRHEYSTSIRLSAGTTHALVRKDGRESLFTVQTTAQGTVVTPPPTELGKISKTMSGWEFLDTDNTRYTFNSDGKLTRQESSFGSYRNLSYLGSTVTVTDEKGNQLVFTEDKSNQPLTLTQGDLQITYLYNPSGLLQQIIKTEYGKSSNLTYHYEDTRSTKLLTGITDESGVRYATWSYDEIGRAVSSEHNNGAEIVTVAYNADGSATVINGYGKKIVYRFQIFHDVKRVTAIEGEPSTNCPFSNSTFTYDAKGLLKTKIDAKGNLTTYDYNNRGLEVSRTEASGTLQARTTTTEWHPSLFLKTKVTEPDRITTYQYDAQGRQTGQIVTPR